MKLDRTFIADINKVTANDGTSAGRATVKTRLRACATKMSTIDIAEKLNEIIKEYGRAMVGICIAQKCAAEHYEDRHSERLCNWSRLVLAACKLELGDNGTYNDGLHPTKVDDYSACLIDYTIAE